MNPLDYWGEWRNYTFNDSPVNWRFPFYTILLDKFVDRNPRNDDANGTVIKKELSICQSLMCLDLVSLFEHDVMGNQLWHGGDVKGLMDSLDYPQGMGIKVCMDDFRRCCLSC